PHPALRWGQRCRARLGTLFPGAPLRAPRSLAVLTFKEIWNRSFCRPREQLVDIITEFPNEVEYIFRPSCVSLQRCGGCCGDEGLRCVPVQTGTVTVQVSTAPWDRDGGGLLESFALAASHPHGAVGDPDKCPARGVPTPVLCARPGGRVRPLVAQSSLSPSLRSPQCAVHNKSCCHQLSASLWGWGFPAACDLASGDGWEVPAAWQLPCARRRTQLAGSRRGMGRVSTRGHGCFMVSGAARVLALRCR
uniref:Platelet-derived growth factor (PDGF) family profile domain-containing protein n=1 Tax=Phasianus colchicus TaxID=9054 RepID=A0A669PMR2_PHACC